MKDNEVLTYVTGDDANDWLQNALTKHGCGLAASSVPSVERVDVTFRELCPLCLFVDWILERKIWHLLRFSPHYPLPFSSHSELVKVLGHQLEPLSRFCDQRPPPLSSDGSCTRLHRQR